MIPFNNLVSETQTIPPLFFLEDKNFIDLSSSKGKMLFHTFVAKNFHADLESYSFSLGYYLITGRRGAWIKGDDNFIIIACKHPNIDHEIMFFAPKYDKERVIDFCQKFGVPVLKFSRLPSSLCDFSQQDETVMDWIYPSHTMSTNDICALDGLKFKRVRRKLSLFKENNIRFVSNEMLPPKDLITLLTKQAETLSKTQSLSKEEIFNSLIEGIRVYEQNKEYMNIGVFYKDDVPFGLIIWDKTLSNHVNLLWLIHDVTIDNICYVLYHTFSKFLNEQNIQYFNVGGSETEGLNDFKLKFRPVQSFYCSNLLVDVAQENKIAA